MYRICKDMARPNDESLVVIRYAFKSGLKAHANLSSYALSKFRSRPSIFRAEVCEGSLSAYSRD